jgi:hypothetical protein
MMNTIDIIGYHSQGNLLFVAPSKSGKRLGADGYKPGLP